MPGPNVKHTFMKCKICSQLINHMDLSSHADYHRSKGDLPVKPPDKNKQVTQSSTTTAKLSNEPRTSPVSQSTPQPIGTKTGSLAQASVTVQSVGLSTPQSVSTKTGSPAQDSVTVPPNSQSTPQTVSTKTESSTQASVTVPPGSQSKPQSVSTKTGSPAQASVTVPPVSQSTVQPVSTKTESSTQASVTVPPGSQSKPQSVSTKTGSPAQASVTVPPVSQSTPQPVSNTTKTESSTPVRVTVPTLSQSTPQPVRTKTESSAQVSVTVSESSGREVSSANTPAAAASVSADGKQAPPSTGQAKTTSSAATSKLDHETSGGPAPASGRTPTAATEIPTRISAQEHMKRIEHLCVSEKVVNLRKDRLFWCELCHPSSTLMTLETYCQHLVHPTHMKNVFIWLISTEAKSVKNYQVLVSKLKASKKPIGLFCEFCRKASFNVKDLSSHKAHLGSEKHCGLVQIVKKKFSAAKSNQAPNRLSSQNKPQKQVKPQTATSPKPQMAASPKPQMTASLRPLTSAAPQPQTGASPKPQTSASPKPQTAASLKIQTVAAPKIPTVASPKIPTVASPKPQTLTSEMAASPKPETAASPKPQTAAALTKVQSPVCTPIPTSSSTDKTAISSLIVPEVTESKTVPSVTVPKQPTQNAEISKNNTGNVHNQEDKVQNAVTAGFGTTCENAASLTSVEKSANTTGECETSKAQLPVGSSNIKKTSSSTEQKPIPSHKFHFKQTATSANEPKSNDENTTIDKVVASSNDETAPQGAGSSQGALLVNAVSETTAQKALPTPSNNENPSDNTESSKTQIPNSDNKSSETQSVVKEIRSETRHSESLRYDDRRKRQRSPSWSPDRHPETEDTELPDYEEYVANDPPPAQEIPASESPVEDFSRSSSRQSGATREGSVTKTTTSSSRHKHSKHKHKSKSRKRSRSKSPRRRSSSRSRKRSRSSSRSTRKRSRSPPQPLTSHRSSSPSRHASAYSNQHGSVSHSSNRRSRSPASSRSHHDRERNSERDRDYKGYERRDSRPDSRRDSRPDSRRPCSPPRDSRQQSYDSRKSNSGNNLNRSSASDSYKSARSNQPYGGTVPRRRSRSPARRSRSPHRHEPERESGELRSEKEYGRGAMRSDSEFQRGGGGGGMRSHQGRGGISDQIYGAQRSRSPNRLGGRGKPQKLRPRALSPWSIDSLTFLVDKKWTAFYEKYYNPGQRDDILCLMFQREYLQAYRGFFQDDPHFDLSFPVLMKPEALRTELSERIDRGSPGPTSRDTNTFQPPTTAAVATPPPTAYDTIEPGELVDDDRRREIRRLRWERRLSEPAEAPPPRRIPTPPPKHYQQHLVNFAPKVDVSITPHTSMMSNSPTSPSTPTVAEMHSFAKLKSLIREKLKIPTSQTNSQPAPIDNIQVTDLVKEALQTIASKEPRHEPTAGYEFKDPFLGFVHNVLSGILKMTGLQEEVDTGIAPASVRTELQYEQRRMHESMITPEGHLLIRMARMALTNLPRLASKFGVSHQDVVAILKTLDRDVLQLIGDTPMLKQ